MQHRFSLRSSFLIHFSWLFLILALAPGESRGQPAIFHLKNGDRISGTIASENQTEISLVTFFGSTITLPLAEIDRRETPPPITATTPTPSPVPVPEPAPPAQTPAQTDPPATPPVAVAPEAVPRPVLEAPPDTAALTEDAAQRNAFFTDLQKFLAEWKGEVRLGLNLGFSTRDRQIYTGTAKATHVRGSIKNILDFDATYGRTDGLLSDNRMDGSWKIEHDLARNRRFHIYNSAGAGFNEIQRISLRYDVGPGVGYKWLTRTNFVLRNEFGGNFQQQFYQDQTRATRYSFRFAEEAWWQLSNKLRIEEKFEFFPQVESFGNFRIRFETSLSYLLRNNVTLNLSLIDLYDTDPAPNASKNDLQIRSTLGVKF